VKSSLVDDPASELDGHPAPNTPVGRAGPPAIVGGPLIVVGLLRGDEAVHGLVTRREMSVCHDYPKWRCLALDEIGEGSCGADEGQRISESMGVEL
jgi:hypothetical protein